MNNEISPVEYVTSAHLPESHFVGYKEIPQELRIPYKEFLQGRKTKPGEMVTDVRAKDLYTYQNWISAEKISNVLDYAANKNPLLTQITGYIHFHDKLNRHVIVIGNGNHRTLYALTHGKRLNIEIKEHPNPETEQNPFRITNILNRYGDLFEGF